MSLRATYTVTLAVLAVVSAIVIVFGEIPVTRTTPCLICAVAEWHLSSPEPGKFSAELVSRDPPCGRRRIDLFQFGREDFVSFQSDTGISTGDFVDCGQMVGRIRSIENERLLQETLAQIDEAAATLALLKAGSKKDIVDQARWQLKWALGSEGVAKVQLDRKRGLYTQGHVSEEEIQLAESGLELAGISVRIAEAELAAAKTGEREEAQEAARHALESLRLRGEHLSEKISRLAIRAPFRGQVTAPTDTILIFSVLKIDTMAVEIPVDEADISKIRVGQEFTLRVHISPSRSFPGRMVAVDCRARVIAGRSRFIVTGLVENEELALRHGIGGEAIIHYGRLPIRTVLGGYLSRGLSRLR